MNAILKRITLENEIRAALKLAVTKWKQQHKLMSHAFFEGVRRNEALLQVN